MMLVGIVNSHSRERASSRLDLKMAERPVAAFVQLPNFVRDCGNQARGSADVSL
jgi:hypothetical protein